MTIIIKINSNSKKEINNNSKIKINNNRNKNEVFLF